MAEIRKFDPAAGNAIAQALKAAMGEPVRPAEPGAPAAPRKPAPEPPPAATTWLSLNVKTDEEPDD
jgi:hypothetical protein